MDWEGNPAQCLTLRNRSSSAAATNFPSRTSAAEESPWKALMPRMITIGVYSCFVGAAGNPDSPRAGPLIEAANPPGKGNSMNDLDFAQREQNRFEPRHIPDI